MERRERLAGYGYMTLATMLWGTLPVVVVRADADASVLVGLRMGFGAAALALFGLLFVRSGILPARHRGLIAGLGAMLAVHWAVFFRTIQLIGATAVVVTFLFPVLVALLAPVLIGERRERHVLPLAAVGLSGTALIALAERGSAGLEGTLLALANAVLAALLIIGARRAVDGVPGPVIAFWQQAIGFVVLLPWIGAVASTASVPWAWGVLIGVVHTALGAVLFFRSIGRVPAQEAGVLMYVEPASAVLFVWAVDGSAPALTDVVGGLLVLGAGVALVVTAARGTVRVPAEPALPARSPRTRR